MTVTIRFLGATGTVTGSKYLVTHNGHSLMVDCGLFQGYKQLRLRNRDPLPIKPAEISAVVLTHAHLDHSGYLPLLVKSGFKGTIWASAASCELAGILLPDSGHIQEEDAAFANRHGFSKHKPALPLYTEEDARTALKQLKPQSVGEVFEPIQGWKVQLRGAGHILGACSVLLEVGGKRILFSGDLGRPDDSIMLPPEAPAAADTVIIESTYGDREHPVEDVLAELGPALQRACARGGTAVVPVFAVGRAQALLHAIARLKADGTVPSGVPVYLDSPMAIHTTDLYDHHIGEHRLSKAECNAMEHSAQMTMTPDQSKAIAYQHGPKIILAASGMATGGRVLHHFVQYLEDHRNMVVLTGYQSPGTRGATLAKGGHRLRVHGQDLTVRAEVVQLTAASAHADATQLLDWLKQIPSAPRHVFVTHGDMEASEQLRLRIKSELGWSALVPEHGSEWSV